MQDDIDALVRVVALQWLQSQVAIHGETLPRTTLAEGFIYPDGDG